MTGARIYDHAWRKVAREVLERDGYRCRIRLPGCTVEATQGDHIVPVEAGGARLDPANIRAACETCNKSRAAAAKHREGWRRADTRIVLVAGPPGAGKTTHVEEHAGPGDLVVDYDRIAEAFGSTRSHGHVGGLHQVVNRARSSALTQLRRGEVDVARAWIISANPRAEQMFPHHEAVVVDPGRDVVVERAVAAGRPPRWLQLIDDWYELRAAATSRRW